MRVWSSIANIIAIALASFLIIVFYQMDVIMAKQFDELRLRYALNYASEAAFMSTLEVYDVGIDYVDMEAVTINPSYCLDTFKSLMCLSYDMSLSEENFAYIETFMPVAVLLCNDGFYVASIEEINDLEDGNHGGNYGLHWNMKKPYNYVVKPDKPISATNPLYSITLHSEKWSSVYETNGQVRITYGEEYPAGLSKQTILNAVNNKITEEIRVAINKRNMVNSNPWKTTFYLPSDLTASGINNLNRPSLLIMLQGADLGRGGKIDAVSVGGVKTERKRIVVGFTQNGIKYYCYEKQLPESMLENVEEFYDDVEDAARAGYKPHYEYLAQRYRETFSGEFLSEDEKLKMNPLEIKETDTTDKIETVISES